MSRTDSYLVLNSTISNSRMHFSHCSHVGLARSIAKRLGIWITLWLRNLTSHRWGKSMISWTSTLRMFFTLTQQMLRWNVQILHWEYLNRLSLLLSIQRLVKSSPSYALALRGAIQLWWWPRAKFKSKCVNLWSPLLSQLLLKRVRKGKRALPHGPNSMDLMAVLQRTRSAHLTKHLYWHLAVRLAMPLKGVLACRNLQKNWYVQTLWLSVGKLKRWICAALLLVMVSRLHSYKISARDRRNAMLAVRILPLQVLLLHQALSLMTLLL